MVKFPHLTQEPFMDTAIAATAISFVGLAGAGISVWVSLRERIVRAETMIEVLNGQHKDHKSEVQLLRDWLDGQFGELRKVLDRKADR
jgi:hypothetical protein